MRKKTPFRRLMKCFSSLFPAKYNRRDYDTILYVATKEEEEANQSLFNFDHIVFPKILENMEKNGYYYDVEDIKQYLYRYCLLVCKEEQNG